MEQLDKLDKIDEVRELDDTIKLNTKYTRTNLATPMVLFVAAFLVGMVSLWSHILLSVVSFRCKYNICYICGLTWWKCVCIQCISDAVPTVFAIIVALPLIYYGTNYRQSYFLLGMCAVAVLLLYVVGEAIGILFLRQGNIMENMEEAG